MSTVLSVILAELCGRRSFETKSWTLLKSLFMGIGQCVPGNRIGDIGAVIQHYTEDENGYGDVREFVGHGIQPTMHDQWCLTTANTVRTVS